MLADKAYPDWEPKQRLEMARNQFIQGVASASIQLVLMREKPKTVEELSAGDRSAATRCGDSTETVTSTSPGTARTFIGDTN